MSAKFRWYAASGSKGCELSWEVGNARRNCDEIRLAFVTGHAGIDTQFSGYLYATFSYFDAVTSNKVTVAPLVHIVMGDQTQPSKFVLHARIKFDRPIEIKPSTMVILYLAALPSTGTASSTVVVQSLWCLFSYYLRGNEDSARFGGS